MWKTITWLFEPPMLLFFTFRTVEWALNILIFTEKHVCSWMDTCMKSLCFSQFFFYLSTLFEKMLKLSLVLFPPVAAEAFLKSKEHNMFVNKYVFS